MLVICAASRSDQTCPGEMSKGFRLATLAREALDGAECEVDLLDLSELLARAVHERRGRAPHPEIATAEPRPK